jgi:hypothetical protein
MNDEMIYQRQDNLEKKAQFNFNIHIMIQTSCTILNRAQLSLLYIQGVQLKSGPYFNVSNLFTKIYNMLYYTTNLYLQ